MESNKILQADLLDILFEDRNKEYGAYELRKTYDRRLYKAMLVMGSVIGLLFVGNYVAGRGVVRQANMIIVDSVRLVNVTDPVPPPPPPPPPVIKTPPVATIVFTKPLLVKNDPPDEVKPPEQTDLDHVRIGTVNTPGGEDVGVVAPPAGDGERGIIDKPVAKEESEFFIVEQESEYPGGMAAWNRFLQKNLQVPSSATEETGSCTIVVEFIVDEEGNVSDVHAISGPEQGGLREEAVRVIKKSGKWKPALQNGRNVKSFKKQPIIIEIRQE